MLPCSEVHWKILPAVSRELAECLEKEHVTRTRIAEVIGTSPAAISQYISGKRGGMRLSKDAADACCALAKKIAAGEVKDRLINSEIAEILAVAKNSGLGKNDPCIICMTPTTAKQMGGQRTKPSGSKKVKP
jgi:predicted transcriptional regulator